MLGIPFGTVSWKRKDSELRISFQIIPQKIKNAWNSFQNHFTEENTPKILFRNERKTFGNSFPTTQELRKHTFMAEFRSGLNNSKTNGIS
jgi:hypothetical protein